MKHVGAYEAKTHLAALLDEISKGERITITKHGVPVALLSPADREIKGSVDETIKEIRKFRKKRPLKGVSLRDLKEEGRR